MPKADEIRTKRAGETRNAAVSFAGLLDSDELLSGTPTTSVSPSGPTITGHAVSTTELTISGEATPIGQAVEMAIAGGTAGVVYAVTVTVPSTTKGQASLERTVYLEVE